MKLARFPATRRSFAFYVADSLSSVRQFTHMIQQDRSSVTRFVTIRVIRVVTALLMLFIPVTHIHAQTQPEMNAQARADFKQTDAELNKTYQSVLAKLSTAEKQKLKQAQRAWIASRDAEAARAAKEAEGGSMAPTLRYEKMAELTQERTNELKAMVANGPASSSNRPTNISTPSPTSIPESQPEKTQSASETESSVTLTSESVSPDKKWKYKCAEYGVGQCAPEILKAGTDEVVLDLDEEGQVHGPEASQAEVIWAPDSKRFAFNYSPPHAHHTTYETVAFYQLRGDKWEAMHSPVDESSERLQLAQLAKKQLPKSAYSRHPETIRDILKVRSWTHADTAILYARAVWEGSGSQDSEASFLFTLKFDASGNSKIVKTRRMSEKEIESRENEQ